MLAETVKSWTNKARQEGRHEGMEGGMEKGRRQEAAKLFLLLLESKFGAASQEMQAKIRQTSPEGIE